MVSPSKGSVAPLRPDEKRARADVSDHDPTPAFWWLAALGVGALLLMGASLGDAKLAPGEKGTVVLAGS